MTSVISSLLRFGRSGTFAVLCGQERLVPLHQLADRLVRHSMIPRSARLRAYKLLGTAHLARHTLGIHLCPFRNKGMYKGLAPLLARGVARVNSDRELLGQFGSWFRLPWAAVRTPGRAEP